MAINGLSRNQFSPKTYAILLRQAKMCKRRLTEEPTAKMSLNLNSVTYQSEYINQRLLSESAGLLTKIKKVLSRALRDSELSLNDLNAVKDYVLTDMFFVNKFYFF